jgi:hypothetical protein
MSILTECDFCKRIVGRGDCKFGTPVHIALGSAKKYYHCCHECCAERSIGPYAQAEEVVESTLEECLRILVREEMEAGQ